MWINSSSENEFFMFLPINTIPPLATRVIEVREKGPRSTFVNFQTAGNHWSEEKPNICDFLEILVLKQTESYPLSRLYWLDK